MMDRSGKVYIGSILMETHRWSEDKTPSYAVSAWTDRFAEAGLDGIELWEYHATLVDDAERLALKAAACPTAIFNSYASMTDADEPRRRRAAELTVELGATGVKFNVGAEPSERGEYLRNLAAWRAMVPDDVTLLCECHPGTIIEDADDAKAFFDELHLDGVEMIVHPFNRAESLPAWFDAFGPKVAHAHLQMRQGREIVRFDHDPARAEGALRTMKAAGFDGSMTLEFTAGSRDPDAGTETLWESALADLAFLRERL